MKPGKTELRLNAEIEKRGALFAVLLDPDTSDEAAFVKAGAMAAENGADLLLVGGSYLGNFTLPKQVAALKANVDLPVVLFPGGASQVVPGFDAMLFMTLVSGRNPNYLIDEQVRGGALVRALNMEAIPTAYQLINSGKRTTVEYISGTMPVPANKPKLSMVNSIAAELMGMRYVYLEAGSGAEEPVPVEHIAYTRKATEMTIITGGGIKDPQTAATWWDREQPTYDEIIHAANNLKSYDNTVDYIITHEPPASLKDCLRVDMMQRLEVHAFFEDLRLFAA